MGKQKDIHQDLTEAIFGVLEAHFPKKAVEVLWEGEYEGAVRDAVSELVNLAYDEVEGTSKSLSKVENP